MTVDNLIIIKGGAYNDVKRALKQWIDLYSNDLEDGLTFKLFKNGRGNHMIQADERLDNDKFYYLINYLKYPEGVDYKIDVEGFTVGKDDNLLKGRRLLVYISQSDKDYDNVFVVTNENNSYKVDFGGKILKALESRVFVFPVNLSFENPEILKINQKEFAKKKLETNKSYIDKRFKLISVIVLGLMLISAFTCFYDQKVFIKFTFFIGLGLGVWFFGDYKMLQSNKYYAYCLLLSIAFLSYSILINQELNLKDGIIDLGALCPIALLIVQKPTRFIFKSLLNREPVIDRPPPTFWDGVYTVILFLSFVIVPFIIMDSLK
ncbi:hypothetical protein RCC89_19850 [Cytophagaceae bacterium ABcell3]|nr:hypothetical protein RCC89_19850 [Cytophagaceae bacterium ABcell3]